MNSEGYQTNTNTPSSEDMDPTAAAIRNGENSDWTTKDEQQRSHLPQEGVARREKSALCFTKYAPHRTTMTRSPTSGDERPREFITGIEYRTKFMREITNGKNLHGTTKARIYRPRLSQVDVTRREKSASCTMKYASRSALKTRSLTFSDEKPREFITGIEYRTKFMRENQYDSKQKFRFSSGTRNFQQTRADTITLSRWRPNRGNICLVKQPTRKEYAKRSTSEVGPNHPQPLRNRKPPQFNKSTAEVRMKHAAGNSLVKSKNSGKTKPPFDAKPETIKVGGVPMYHKPSRAATPFSDATKTQSNLIQREAIKTRFKMNETSRFRLDLEETNDSIDPHIFDKFLHGINKADLSIDLPNSPGSEPRDSNSLHTTPRSPRLVQKNPANYSPYSAISEAISHLPGNSIHYSEILETHRASSPVASVSSTPKQHGLSKKYKFLPSSDITPTTKTGESVAKEPRTKTSAFKQEPMTFTTQFVPLLRWTDKTNSGGLFELHAHDGSNSRLNSTANQDGGNASSNKFHEHELSNLPSKDTASFNDNTVQNEIYPKQQQVTANEDCNILHPSLMNIPGKGGKITNVTISKKKSMTQGETPPKDAVRSHTRNHPPVGRKALKLTGPQQAVSGYTLCPTPGSQLPRRPQSMKTIMTTKQPPAYKRNAIQPLGDFARRPISAGIKGKIKEATVNKKPVWK